MPGLCSLVASHGNVADIDLDDGCCRHQSLMPPHKGVAGVVLCRGSLPDAATWEQACGRTLRQEPEAVRFIALLAHVVPGLHGDRHHAGGQP